MGAKIERGLYVVCDRRRVQWDDLVEIQKTEGGGDHGGYERWNGQLEEDEEGKESE